MNQLRGLAVPVLCVALSVGVFACGSSSEKSARTVVTEQPTKDNRDDGARLSSYLVTANDVAKGPPASPERALLTWWQAMQYSNYTEAYRLVSPRLRRQYSPKRFRRAARFAAVGGFNNRPRVVERRDSRNRATLLVNLLFYRADKVIAVVPKIFRLVKAQGGWRLADLQYFEEKAAEGRAAKG